jgi:hypothetical protein
VDHWEQCALPPPTRWGNILFALAFVASIVAFCWYANNRDRQQTATTSSHDDQAYAMQMENVAPGDGVAGAAPGGFERASSSAHGRLLEEEVS